MKCKCRGCGAKIMWLKTPAGKNMPVDPEPVTFKRTPGGTARIVTSNGETVACELGPFVSLAGTEVGWIPHWSTCPNWKDFKRPKGEK